MLRWRMSKNRMNYDTKGKCGSYKMMAGMCKSNIPAIVLTIFFARTLRLP